MGFGDAVKTLHSPQLILRPLLKEDREPLVALLGDAAMMAHLLADRPMDRAEARAFLDARFTGEDEPEGLNVLALRATPGPIGFAGILPTTCMGREGYEFGFAVLPSFQGRGVATQIGCRQMAYAFEELNLPRILALVHPENGPSLTVVERHLGMVCIGTAPASGERGLRRVFCRDRSEGLPTVCRHISH